MTALPFVGYPWCDLHVQGCRCGTTPCGAAHCGALVRPIPAGSPR